MTALRKPIFDAVKEAGGRFPDANTVALLDGVLTRLGVPKDASGRTVSAEGRALIKLFEGIRLTAYPDPATGGDPWTIGVGHTGPDVHRGLTITVERADELLQHDLNRFEDAVNKLAPVTTQMQFDALVSFAFNLGEGNLQKSTLLKKHNAGDYAGAKGEFGKWNKAAGHVMDGLTRRRAAEARVYGGGV